MGHPIMRKRILLLTAMMSLGTSGCICVPPPGCCATGPRLLPPMLLPPIGCVLPGPRMAGFQPVSIPPAGHPTYNTVARQRQVVRERQFAAAAPAPVGPRLRTRNIFEDRVEFRTPKLPRLPLPQPTVQYPKAKRYPAVVQDRPQNTADACQCDHCKKHSASGCRSCQNCEAGVLNTCAAPVDLCATCNAVTGFGSPMHRLKPDTTASGCGCDASTKGTVSSPPANRDEEPKSANVPSKQVPPPAPIPPPPEEEPEPAQDMTEPEDEPPSFGSKEDWNPRTPPNDASSTPAGSKLPPVEDVEPVKSRPEFEEPTPAPQEFDNPDADDIQPVNYETWTSRNSRTQTASRQIRLSNSGKTSDNNTQKGETPDTRATIPARSVTRKRIQ